MLSKRIGAAVNPI